MKLLGLPLSLLAIVVLISCGEDDPSKVASVGAEDPGPVHVHGLGINPSDRALFVATHTGLFRVAQGEQEAVRIAGRYQDTMGFTIVGPDHFLGSGHPDGVKDPDLPPFLGLIESRDAGGSWEPVSLLGEADFHALEARGERIYGFGADWETRESQFLVSDDGGEVWESLPFPEPFISVAMHPRDPDRIATSGESGNYLSEDAGQTWRKSGSETGFVAWRTPTDRVMADEKGRVLSSNGRTGWRRVGDVGGPPAAFEAAGRDLYVALHDGTIKRSANGGESWKVRFRP